METALVPINLRLAAVRDRIKRACERSGRDPAAITLIGASKGMRAERMVEAFAAGLTDIGENYVAEARAKKEALVARQARWHLIGHLQRNKVNDALEVFDLIHSIDSVRLAEAVSSRAKVPVGVLLEVNVAAEASKFGLAPSEVAAAVSAIGGLPNLVLQGLMTIAPATGNPETVRPVFRELAALAAANGLRELSMGMSDDFETAIEEGATMIRVGRAIFGERKT